MKSQLPPNSPLLNFLPFEIEGFDAVAELALDLRWSWNHSADAIWKQLDPTLWELTSNPWAVVCSTSRDKLAQVLSNPDFRKQLTRLLEAKRTSSPAWFQQTHPASALTGIAYFSMEFMLSEGLPIYSGGLGNVAGDQLKAASDLGLPVVGVGLLYQQGYFRQEIDKEGRQQALFPYNDPTQMPIVPVRRENGERVRVEIKLPGYSLFLHAWEAQVGRVKLYLLDSNAPENLPIHRGITSELYGGDSELRLKQELLLGIGGWRLLHTLGIKLAVCHLNEGHAAFAVLERARHFMEETTNQPFEVALAATRAGNLFTTHTAVSAGFDRFSPDLIAQYLRIYAEQLLHISLHDLLALGRLNPQDAAEPFNMAYLAIRGSRAINGVSRLHAQVSRHIFAPLFPRWPEAEVPIGYVTNGVHVPSWDSAAADTLWTDCCGKSRWLEAPEKLGDILRQVPDSELWQMRNAGRKQLIAFARARLTRQVSSKGAAPETIERAKHLFDPNVLTLGFARRFATYKRPNMLLSDPERLLRLLNHPQRPVQLIIAGKAHPADLPGQQMIQEWIRFIKRPEAADRVIFLTDYDMLITEPLVQGVDVWINTPRRPWEACGTSGMKVLVNGGLNLSELDGWWAEAYCPEVGWALGDGQEHGEDPAWDREEANQLYDLLENEVTPLFYTRDQEGIPSGWVAKMRESMARLTPHFSANRSVREYTEEHYLPAAAAYLERTANQGAKGKQLVDWTHQLSQSWEALRFGQVTITSDADAHHFEVEVYLDDLPPDSVQVELYADQGGKTEMTSIRQLAGTAGMYLYGGSVPATAPATDYTPRVIPHHPDAVVPLEAAQILWQR